MKLFNPLQFLSRKEAVRGSGLGVRSRQWLILLTCMTTSGVILAPPVEEDTVCRLLRNPNAPNPPSSGAITSYYQCKGTCPGGPPAPECRMMYWPRGEWKNYACWCSGVKPPSLCKGSVEMKYYPDMGVACFDGPWCETKLCANDCTVNSSGTEVCTCP